MATKISVHKDFLQRSVDDFNKIVFDKTLRSEERFVRLENSVRNDRHIARHCVNIAGQLTKIRSSIDGNTLVHIAMYDKKAAMAASRNRLILMIENFSQFSVAHAIALYTCNEQAVRKIIMTNLVASLTNANGDSVSHFAVCNYSIAADFVDNKISLPNLVNNSGISVLDAANRCITRQVKLNEYTALVKKYAPKSSSYKTPIEKSRYVELKGILR